MYELCRHLLPSGRRCTQPAVTGAPEDKSPSAGLYCRHHRIVKRTMADSVLPPRFHGLHKPLPFLYPEDRAAIQANCFLVMRALDDRRISTQTANALNRLLRTCQANLKHGPLHESDSEVNGRKPKSSVSSVSSVVNPFPDDAGAGAPRLDFETWPTSVILTPAGEEMALPCEVWEEGEQPHHGEACPCRRCAQQYRGAGPEAHHADCRCGDCPLPAGGEQNPALPSGQDILNAGGTSESRQAFAPASAPYLAEPSKEEQEQESEHRKQILEKHKDRFLEIEKQYQYSPLLAERITATIQEIMEQEMGHEAFSYPLHQLAASLPAATSPVSS